MMAGGRVYGGSNMAVFETVPCSTDALEALLISSSSPGFHERRRKIEHHEYFEASHGETCEEDLDECFHQPEKKRRLSADQVQFLERSFEVENKLEPERKIQLARDLGLQPRQVAIWFQNRRARWKTKQLEKDYEALKANYNSLKADYENLLKEKEKLKTEVILLTDKLHFKEKDLQTPRGNSEKFEFNNRQSHSQSHKPDSNSVSVVKEPDGPIRICKLEDLSSANSAVSDSESLHYTDGDHSSLVEPAVSSNIFEPDQSDLSHAEEEEDDDPSKNLLPLVYNLPKLEDSIYEDPPGSSCNYAFQVDDQAFWFWP